MSKILIVDDEKTIRKFLARVLQNAGHTVQTAENGESALRCLHHEQYDLLLSDIRMSHIDGVELMKRARDLVPDMAVILLTGHATVQSAVAALRHGATDYLLKPVSNEEILDKISQALATRAQAKQHAVVNHLAKQIGEAVSGTKNSSTLQPSLLLQSRLAIDADAYQAHLDGTTLDLTPTEFRLLQTLASTPGKAYDYIALVENACGYRCDRAQAREIIGTHVRNLRTKFDADSGIKVASVRGVGYRLVIEAAQV